MIIRFGFTLLGPFIGGLSAKYSLSFALQASGLILLILSGTAAWFLFRQLGNEVKEL